jgi:hypothetical protein
MKTKSIGQIKDSGVLGIRRKSNGDYSVIAFMDIIKHYNDGMVAVKVQGDRGEGVAIYCSDGEGGYDKLDGTVFKGTSSLTLEQIADNRMYGVKP